MGDVDHERRLSVDAGLGWPYRQICLTGLVEWDNDVFGLAWGPMTAAAVIYSLPVIVITLALQKQIIGGLTFGAVKG